MTKVGIDGHRFMGLEPQPMDGAPLLSGKETAAKLKIHPRTLRRQILAGRPWVEPVPNTKPPKWRAVDVDAFLFGDGNK